MGSENVMLLTLWASPFAMSCAIALKEKGVHFSTEENIPHKSQLLLDSNPIYKQVPVLILNGKPVSQSSVILEYIEEAWPAGDGRPSLLPSDLYQRAVARFWVDFGNSKFIETGLKLMKKVGEEYETARKEIVEDFMLFEKGLSTFSSDGPFFFGNNLTLPDVVMASLVCWIYTYESLGNLKFPDAETCPRMHKWLAAMRELPSVKSMVPDNEKLLKHCTNFRQNVIEEAAQANR